MKKQTSHQHLGGSSAVNINSNANNAAHMNSSNRNTHNAAQLHHLQQQQQQQQYSSAAYISQPPPATITTSGAGQVHQVQQQPHLVNSSSGFLAKTTTKSTAHNNKPSTKGANSTKKREEATLATGAPLQQFSINSQSTESLKNMNQKSKKQMLMLQLLQNFQDFGSFKKKQEDHQYNPTSQAPSTVIHNKGGSSSQQHHGGGSLSTKNFDSKSILLMAPNGSSLLQNHPAAGGGQPTSQSNKHQQAAQQLSGGKGKTTLLDVVVAKKRNSKHQQTTTHSVQLNHNQNQALSVDVIDQGVHHNTRNNEAAAKSFLNSQRIPNLEHRLNGLSAVQQNKLRAQASSKQEYDRGSNIQEMQGSLKKLATQEIVFNMSGQQQAQNTNSKKQQSLQKGKQSVVQRSNMTPKLGIVGLGQHHAGSNSAAKANTGNKNQSNFAIYNNQQLGSGVGSGAATSGLQSQQPMAGKTTQATGASLVVVQQEPKKSSAINQYASAARMMPQNVIATSSLAQHTHPQQTSVFNSAHGSTMMDQNLLQNLTLQQNPTQNFTRSSQALPPQQLDNTTQQQNTTITTQVIQRGNNTNTTTTNPTTIQYEMDPTSIIQQSGKGSIISGMSLTDIQQQQQQFAANHNATTTTKRRQQSQHLMNIISGVTIPAGQQQAQQNTNGKALVKTQSAFLQTQEQLNALHHQQQYSNQQEMVVDGAHHHHLNGGGSNATKRKVTRLKGGAGGEKKASRNATQSLLDHPSFKSKNSNQNTTKQQAIPSKVNTQKLNFPKHAIGKSKLVSSSTTNHNHLHGQNTNENVSHSTVIAAANMRSKSQKKKDLFANLIAEAQDSFAKHNGNHAVQTMTTLQHQTESQKIKKMHSQSNLHPVVGSGAQNKTIAAMSSGKLGSDPKTKRLIFQGSGGATVVQQQLQTNGCTTTQQLLYDSATSVTTPQGMASNTLQHHAAMTSPNPRSLKKSVLQVASGSQQILAQKAALKMQPPSCTSPYIMTQPNQTMVKGSLTNSHRDNAHPHNHHSHIINNQSTNYSKGGLKTASKYSTQSPSTTNRGSIIGQQQNSGTKAAHLQQTHHQSPTQRFKQNIVDSQTTLRLTSTNSGGTAVPAGLQATANAPGSSNPPVVMNLAVSSAADQQATTIGGKVVVQRGHHQRHHSGILADHKHHHHHQQQQQFLILNDGQSNLIKGLINDQSSQKPIQTQQQAQIQNQFGGIQNVNSTSTLQDYSEYQLSFRQDHPKSSMTPLDNVLVDGHFSARQMSESHSKSPEVVYQHGKTKNAKVHNSASQEPRRGQRQKRRVSANVNQGRGGNSHHPDENNSELIRLVQDQSRQIAKLERKVMAQHIVKHLELEVGQQLEAANGQIVNVHIADENKDQQQQHSQQTQQQQANPSDPTMAALDQLKKRMIAHVQKTQLVNQKLAYRVICLEQQLQQANSCSQAIAVEEEGGGGLLMADEEDIEQSLGACMAPKSPSQEKQDWLVKKQTD